MHFAGWRGALSRLEQAVRNSELEALQRQERERGFIERFSRHNPFFRSGKVGGWREYLNQAQIARLEAGCAAAMAKMGYERNR